MTLYALLLFLYPSSFRAEYGEELRAIFARRWRQDRGIGWRVVLLFEALGEVV